MCRVQLKKDREHNESPNKNVISCLPAISLLLSSWASASTGASPPRSSSNPRLLPGSDRRFQRIWTTDTGSTFDSGLLYDLDSRHNPSTFLLRQKRDETNWSSSCCDGRDFDFDRHRTGSRSTAECRSSEAQVQANACIRDCGRQFPSTAKADWDKRITCQAQCMDACK
jgi:hypothetical protein